MESRRQMSRRSETRREALRSLVPVVALLTISSCSSYHLGGWSGWTGRSGWAGRSRTKIRTERETSKHGRWMLSSSASMASSDSTIVLDKGRNGDKDSQESSPWLLQKRKQSRRQKERHRIGVPLLPIQGAEEYPHVASTISLAPEWSRAIEIGSVLGDTIRPLFVSWIQQRRRENSREQSGSGDNDFWTLRCAVDANEVGGWTNAEWVTLSLERLGCTFVKFGQAMASRPDLIPPELASTLLKLQDRMEPFDSRLAVEIIRRELAPSVGGVERGTGANRPSAVLPSQQCFENFLSSLSPEPVAAASIGQVYRGYLDGYGPVAVKVRRPDIEQVVERDAALLRSLASSVEQVSAMWHASTPFPPLVKAKLVDAVDEFMNRIREELDYRREAENLQTFASLYSSSHDQKQRTSAKRPKVQVVVPRLVEDMCTENVLVTEWLDGSKLVDQDVSRHSIASNESAEREIVRGLREESLSLVLTGIECTLSQLLDTGILHADPHSGNLLKVPSKHCEGSYELGYLDFGLLSRVPSEVRDGLVCAVAQLVFARNVDKVARLFGELQLLPQHVLHDPTERQALAAALDSVFEKVLDYSESEPVSGRDGFESRKRNRSAIPGLRFDSLLVSLAGLVTRFEFQLPPYFLNNARALGTLEGIAKSLDPAFNVLRVVYPYALNRLLANPSNNPVVDETLLDLLRCPSTGTIKASRVARLLDDSAALTGYSRRRVAWDVLKTCGGRRLARKIALGLAGGRLARVKKAYRTGLFSTYFKL